MGMTIEDIKHCLNVMVDCKVCEECNLYGMTGTDHCEHDCVCGALDIIDKYQKIQQIVNSNPDYIHHTDMDTYKLNSIREVLEDATN